MELRKDMNRFVFKLEPLYDYRQRLEEASQREFSEALLLLEEEERKLIELQNSYIKGCEDLDRLKEEGGQAEELGMYGAYFYGLKKHISEQQQIIESARQLFEARRSELEEATKEKKVVETLKEKSYDQYVKDLDKAEQKENDDLVSSRFKRGRDNEI